MVSWVFTSYYAATWPPSNNLKPGIEAWREVHFERICAWKQPSGISIGSILAGGHQPCGPGRHIVPSWLPWVITIAAVSGRGAGDRSDCAPSLCSLRPAAPLAWSTCLVVSHRLARSKFPHPALVDSLLINLSFYRIFHRGRNSAPRIGPSPLWLHRRSKTSRGGRNHRPL